MEQMNTKAISQSSTFKGSTGSNTREDTVIFLTTTEERKDNINMYKIGIFLLSV